MTTDQNASLSDLKEKVSQFCSERQWDPYHGAKDLAIGMSTEAAELLEIFRFYPEKEVEALVQDPAKREEIADELSDVFFFILRFAQKFDFDIASSFEKKMQKNAQKYPVDRSRGSNKKYDEL